MPKSVKKKMNSVKEDLKKDGRDMDEFGGLFGEVEVQVRMIEKKSSFERVFITRVYGAESGDVA
jgi:hypothetical protein